MANYGEELVYWYLRLNGFFLLTDFVQHAKNLDADHSTDRDILAVRFPYVDEEVGGQDNDWDECLFDSLDTTKIVGLIGEVKAGRSSDSSQLNDESGLEYSLKRLGFFQDIEDAKKKLSRHRCFTYDGFTVVKVFFTRSQNSCLTSQDKFIPITLEHVERFIRCRIQKYPVEKYKAWNLFQSELLQYMVASETSCCRSG